MATPKLTPGLLKALQDIADYTGRPYWFKPKRMEQLEALGLVERCGKDKHDRQLWRITDAGRAAISEDANG